MLATACVDRGAYSRFEQVPPEGWAYGDTLRFPVERADSTAPATLRLAVRNSNAYPYSNLWLEVTYNHEGRRHIDTVEIRLADVYGRWTGQGFGPEYQSEVKMVKSVVPDNGSWIGVRHVMRVDTITGLEQIGVTLTP